MAGPRFLEGSAKIGHSDDSPDDPPSIIIAANDIVFLKPLRLQWIECVELSDVRVRLGLGVVSMACIVSVVNISSIVSIASVF